MRSIVGILLVGLGGSAATLLPPLVGLPIFVARFDPDHKASALGTALGAYAFTQMLLAPVFGAISDRTAGRLGMRRPGLIVGSLIIFASLVVQGLAASVAGLTFGVVVMGVGSAVFTASFAALIPDQIPAGVRGRVLGFQSLILVLTGVLSTIVGPKLIANQLLTFTAGGVVLLVAVAVALALIEDRVLDRSAVPERSIARTVLEGYRFNPRSAPDFAWVWASRFLITLGISFATSFTVYFLTDRLHVDAAALPGLITTNGLVGLVGLVLGTAAGSLLGDRVANRKNLVLAAAALLAAGGVVVAAAPSVAVFLVGSAILQFGGGFFLPTDGALVMDVLPGQGQQTSKFMAIITIADQLPRSVGPVLAPAVIAAGAATELGGYPLLYLVAGAVALIGGLTIRQVGAKAALRDRAETVR